MNSLCWMLLYFLHLVHKLKWSGMLGLLHLASRIYFPDRCLRRVSWYRLCSCRKRARERRKRSLPARAETANHFHPRAPKLQKIIFIRPTTDHAEFSIMALRWVGSAGHIFPTPELDSHHYVCFDRHAIAVTTIGDDRNKSFYLPQKHLSIYNTKDLFLHAPPPADHIIMLPPTARQHAACLFWSPLIAVPTVVDHRNNLANMH